VLETVHKAMEIYDDDQVINIDNQDGDTNPNPLQIDAMWQNNDLVGFG